MAIVRREPKNVRDPRTLHEANARYLDARRDTNYYLRKLQAAAEMTISNDADQAESLRAINEVLEGKGQKFDGLDLHDYISGLYAYENRGYEILGPTINLVDEYSKSIANLYSAIIDLDALTRKVLTRFEPAGRLAEILDISLKSLADPSTDMKIYASTPPGYEPKLAFEVCTATETVNPCHPPDLRMSR